MQKAYTLLELLITVSLLIVLLIVLLWAFNPKTQIDKADDGKRKGELTSLNKTLEDWYNDYNCYPRPDQICYNAVEGETTCNICGNDLSSPDFNPYLSQLPCDPKQPTKKYLYQVDNINCPSWYRIYSDLSNSSDPVIAQVGCTSGCGPDGSYDYGVSSPNIGLQDDVAQPTNTPTPTSVVAGSYYCQSYGNCSLYDTQLWTCTPNYADPLCGDTSNCSDTVSSCIRK